MDRHSLLANQGLVSDETQIADSHTAIRSMDSTSARDKGTGQHVYLREEDTNSETQIVDSASMAPSETVSENDDATHEHQPVSAKSSFNLGETKLNLATTAKTVKPLDPLIRQDFSTGLRFWTVWRVLGLMFSSILGGILLGILSLVTVVDGNWPLADIGRMNLGLMTTSSLFLTGSSIFVTIKVVLTRGEKRTNEQIWVLSLVLLCWLQPYLNPIALGFRWNSVSVEKEKEGFQRNIERGYTINEARISGCCSTLLISGLYTFCFYEMQRFRAERIRYWRLILLLYFIGRVCFTFIAEMDMGSVPISQICTLIRFQIADGENLPIARICGIVIISVFDMGVWITNFVFHRSTRPLLMRRIYDEEGKARAVQYGLSVVTVVIWTAQIFGACIVILCTPSYRLLSRNLAFSGTSVNTIGCCCAFMLVCWVLALAFANFPLASRSSEDKSSKKAKLDAERVRVRYYNLEREVPSWAVLIVNGRRHFSNRANQRTRNSGERQSSMNSQDAVIEEQGTTFASKAKHMLTNSINAFGEALSSDWSMPVLDSNQNGGTVVNFVLEHACLCLNFSFIVYNTGNFSKPQTNDQVQLLVEDPSYKVHRQISSPQLDVHAIVFASKEAVIVSFRGTHSSQNIRTDATFNWKNHHPSLDWEYDSSSYWARRFTPKIHAGFRKAYAAIRSSLLICVEELLDEDPMRPIRLCGHSMGGSLACLFAFDVRKKLNLDPAQISVYTFGSSRLGNESFRVRYNDAIPQSFSFFCARDPVTKLPPRFPFGIPLGYKHHGIPIMLLPNGSLVIKPSRAEVAVLHTYAPTDLNVHRIRAYAQSLINWTVVQGLEQTFRPFWNSVVGQVHRLPFDELRNPYLLRYLLLDDVDRLSIISTPWTSGSAPSQLAKDALLAELSRALSERPFQKNEQQQQHHNDDLVLFVSVNAVRLPTLAHQSRGHHHNNFQGGFSAMSQMGMITPRQIISDIMGMVKRDQQTSTTISGGIEADSGGSTIARRETANGTTLRRPEEATPPSSTDSNVEEVITTTTNNNNAKTNDQSISSSSSRLLQSDVIYVSVTCGSVEATGPTSTEEENDAVDELEQVSSEAKRAVGPWVKGLDKPLAFGGAVQKLRPDVDRLAFRVFRRATECSCEGRLASLIRSIPNTASHAISNAMMVSSSTAGVASLDHRLTREDMMIDAKQPSESAFNSMDAMSDSSMPMSSELNTSTGSEASHLCDSCARPVCLAKGDLAISSVFDDLDAREAKDVIVSASPLNDTGLRENLILKVKLWSPTQKKNTPVVNARRASSRRQSETSATMSPIASKPETTELRTAGPMPLYDAVGLKTIAAGELFPNEFVLHIRPIKAMGAPYIAVKSPWYRIRQGFGGGGGSMCCKISIPGVGEKGLTTSRKWARVPFASPASDDLLHHSSIPLVGSLLPRYISTPDVIRENVVLMTEKIKAQKVLQVDFGSDSLVFGSRLLLTGFEEIVVRVRPPKRWFRLNLGRGEIEGYVVVELHKIIRHIANAQMSAMENGLASTNNSFARWFPLRGPNACGKVLLAMELVPMANNNSKSESEISSLLMDSSSSDFSQIAEEDSEIGASSPLRSVRFEPRLSAVTAPHYCLELVLYGLRFLPSEYERISFHIQVRDEYNPRQRISIRTSQIEHMGVVAGWSFAPQRVALGFSDPSSSLEGSEQISLRILDRREDTIAKRDFRLRDILADFAEGQAGTSSTESLVSLFAWLVLPYKSSLLQNKRNPEVKAFIRIVQAEHALSLERSLNLV